MTEWEANGHFFNVHGCFFGGRWVVVVHRSSSSSARVVQFAIIITCAGTIRGRVVAVVVVVVVDRNNWSPMLPRRRGVGTVSHIIGMLHLRRRRIMMMHRGCECGRRG